MEAHVQEVTNPFSAWENFYVIVGSAGGALTGLQFVVIALMTELRRRRSTDQIDAFATPTIVHFCAVLLIASILSAPWQELSNAAIVVGITGGAGVLYTALVMRRVRRQSGYVPVFEDWLFHTALPFVSYATVLAGGLSLVHHTVDAAFGIASASLLLLFIGIHNAWDTVTFIATDNESAQVQDQGDAPKEG
jgi:hypothetical protein